MQLIRHEGPINEKSSNFHLDSLTSDQHSSPPPASIGINRDDNYWFSPSMIDWCTVFAVCTHFIKIYIIWYNYTFLWYYRKHINPFFLICSKLCPAVSIYTQVNIMRLMVDWSLFKHQKRAISKWTLAYNQYRPSGFHELLLCNCVTMRLSKLNSIETDEFMPIKHLTRCT